MYSKKPLFSQTSIPRHCEARSNPEVLICTWIASQTRNDVKQASSLRGTKQSRCPDLHLDCFASSQWRYYWLIKPFGLKP